MDENYVVDGYASLMALLFPDGYCSCRCGPGHHVVSTRDNAASVGGILDLTCNYHKNVCQTHEIIDKIALSAVKSAIRTRVVRK